MTVSDVIEALKSAPRKGTECDVPEGSRYVQISDTLMSLIIEALEHAQSIICEHDECGFD